MPLSTGLLAYYYPPEKQAGLMGLSAAMNQMGGVVATLLAGLLAGIQWNYAFLVYLLGLIAAVMVLLFLPNERLSGGSRPSLGLLKRFHPSVVGMFLVMVLFFIYPTRFAMSAQAGTDLSNNAITFIMVGLDMVAFLVGLVFGKVMENFRYGIKYMAPIGFMLGYYLLSMGSSLPLLLAGSVAIGIANGVGAILEYDCIFEGGAHSGIYRNAAAFRRALFRTVLISSYRYAAVSSAIRGN